jgi:hypothetical protein
LDFAPSRDPGARGFEDEDEKKENGVAGSFEILRELEYKVGGGRLLREIRA